MKQTVMDFTHAYAEPGAHSIIDAIHPVTNLGLWSGETLDEVRKRYPHAEIVNFDEWQAAKAARQDSPVVWDEVTAEEYEEMLGCLPPAYMSGGTFSVGEPDDHHATSGLPRYRAYRATGGKFYRSSRPMTVRELRMTHTQTR